MRIKTRLFIAFGIALLAASSFLLIKGPRTKAVQIEEEAISNQTDESKDTAYFAAKKEHYKRILPRLRAVSERTAALAENLEDVKKAQEEADVVLVESRLAREAIIKKSKHPEDWQNLTESEKKVIEVANNNEIQAQAKLIEKFNRLKERYQQ